MLNAINPVPSKYIQCGDIVSARFGDSRCVRLMPGVIVWLLVNDSSAGILYAIEMPINGDDDVAAVSLLLNEQRLGVTDSLRYI